MGLPHMIMVTTANITDRNGAINMVDYYCDVTDHFSVLKKILVDSGYYCLTKTMDRRAFICLD